MVFNYMLAIMVYPAMIFWDLRRHQRKHAAAQSLAGGSQQSASPLPCLDSQAEEQAEEEGEDAKSYSMYIRTMFRNDDMRLRALCKVCILPQPASWSYLWFKNESVE